LEGSWTSRLRALRTIAAEEQLRNSISARSALLAALAEIAEQDASRANPRSEAPAPDADRGRYVAELVTLVSTLGEGAPEAIVPVDSPATGKALARYGERSLRVIRDVFRSQFSPGYSAGYRATLLDAAQTVAADRLSDDAIATARQILLAALKHPDNAMTLERALLLAETVNTEEAWLLINAMAESPAPIVAKGIRESARISSLQDLARQILARRKG
jgi:hypothetical protein